MTPVCSQLENGREGTSPRAVFLMGNSVSKWMNGINWGKINPGFQRVGHPAPAVPILQLGVFKQEMSEGW